MFLPQQSRATGVIGKKGQRNSLDIVSLNVKNIKTSLNFVKSLSRRFSIIFLQETWLYRYQASTLTDIYDNTAFVSGLMMMLQFPQVYI